MTAAPTTSPPAKPPEPPESPPPEPGRQSEGTEHRAAQHHDLRPRVGQAEPVRLPERTDHLGTSGGRTVQPGCSLARRPVCSGQTEAPRGPCPRAPSRGRPRGPATARPRGPSAGPGSAPGAAPTTRREGRAAPTGPRSSPPAGLARLQPLGAAAPGGVRRLRPGAQP